MCRIGQHVHKTAQGKKLLLNIVFPQARIYAADCTVPIPLCHELLQPMAMECALCSASSKSHFFSLSNTQLS